PGPAVRRPGARQTQDPSDSLRRKLRFTSPARCIFEPFQAAGGKALPPTSNGQKTHRLLLGDLFVGESLRQAQDDPGSKNVPLAAGPGVHDALEFSLLAGGNFNRYRCWHNRHPTKKRHTIQSRLRDITLAMPVKPGEFWTTSVLGIPLEEITIRFE